MISKFSPKASGWAIILVGAAALGGCGRKSGLDLPPNAGAQPQVAAPVDSAAERASQPSVFNSTYGSDVGPVAPKGQRKPFILDPLLD